MHAVTHDKSDVHISTLMNRNMSSQIYFGQMKILQLVLQLLWVVVHFIAVQP